jgi:hypothetical protein
MFFNMKMVYFSLQSEAGGRSRGGDYTWEKDPLNNEQFRKELSLAIGQSLEFTYVNDRAPAK